MRILPIITNSWRIWYPATSCSDKHRLLFCYMEKWTYVKKRIAQESWFSTVYIGDGVLILALVTLTLRLLWPQMFHPRKNGGSYSKESACNAGESGSIPRSGRSLGEQNGYPFQYSCLENSIARGACWASVHESRKKWDKTKQLIYTHTHTVLLSSKVLWLYDECMMATRQYETEQCQWMYTQRTKKLY